MGLAVHSINSSAMLLHGGRCDAPLPASCKPMRGTDHTGCLRSQVTLTRIHKSKKKQSQLQQSFHSSIKRSVHGTGGDSHIQRGTSTLGMPVWSTERVPGLLGLRRETLSHKNKNETKQNKKTEEKNGTRREWP